MLDALMEKQEFTNYFLPAIVPNLGKAVQSATAKALELAQLLNRLQFII